MSGISKQRGVAIVLVMWLVAAMSITVSGALALAREEIGLASSRLGEAQAFALGKGIARLAVMDHARAQTAVDENGDLDPGGPSRVFRSRYEIDEPHCVRDGVSCVRVCLGGRVRPGCVAAVIERGWGYG